MAAAASRVAAARARPGRGWHSIDVRGADGGGATFRSVKRAAAHLHERVRRGEFEEEEEIDIVG